MAVFTSLSQGLSWMVTIVVARILVPGDYGLMTMATILTGYALSLSELGLGSAIIQRADVTAEELSTVFWFLLALSGVLALACFPLAYLTSRLMSEPRVIPITQSASAIFLLTGLQIVPSSLLRKRMAFKAVGVIEMASTATSSLSMLVIATIGGGVWTLVFGSIILTATRTVLYFTTSAWRPMMHFDLRRSRRLLSFGGTIAVGRTLFYVNENVDKYLAGRAWPANTLGLYSFALILAQVPTTKIVSLINNVSYPAFAEVQSDPNRVEKLYLNITKATAVITLPLYVAGFLLGDDLVRVVFGAKWLPMVPTFRLLCLAQIMTSLNAVNNFVHAAQGRPNWGVRYQLWSIILMAFSFALAVPHGVTGMAIPWVSTYLALCSANIYLTLRKLGIGLWAYGRSMAQPITGTAAMAGMFLLANGLGTLVPHASGGRTVVVAVAGTLGLAIYAAYYWFFDRDYVRTLWQLAVKGPALT